MLQNNKDGAYIGGHLTEHASEAPRSRGKPALQCLERRLHFVTHGGSTVKPRSLYAGVLLEA